MAGSDQEPSGLFNTARRLIDSGLGAIQNRLELFVTELKEEKVRLIGILVLASATIFFAMMAVAFLTFTVVFYFAREKALMPALVGITIFYVGGGVAAAFILKNRLTKGPMPFNDTLGEIKKDREWLNTEK